MIKTERLMHILGLIRDRGPVDATTLARKCSVSRRTVFRYIENLEALGYPVYYDEGYCVNRQITIPGRDLSTDDIELIRYCLRHNPLAEDTFFRHRFAGIDRKLADSGNRPSSDGSHSIFQLRSRTMSDKSRSQSSDPLLDRFTRAVIQRRRVVIVYGDSTRRSETVIPIAIRLRRGGVDLMVKDHPYAASRPIDRRQVNSLQIVEKSDST